MPSLSFRVSHKASFIASLVLTLAPGLARAEYRVYQLAITNNQTGNVRSVVSVLDHIQYPGYFPIREFESIRLQDTWMCRGRRGNFEALCPNPRPPAP